MFRGYENMFQGYENMFRGYENMFLGYENIFPGFENMFPGYEICFEDMKYFSRIWNLFRGNEIFFQEMKFDSRIWNLIRGYENAPYSRSPVCRFLSYLCVIVCLSLCISLFLSILFMLTLFIMGGGGEGLSRSRIFYLFFLLKNSLLDHTLRPTCKFLILAIFYHAKKNLKILYIKSFTL